jgi:type VI secretion system protein ImpA
MASPSVIDIESLLQPISDESPTGQDPREDSSPLSIYQQIKTARYAARDAEKNSLYADDAPDADEYWRKIISETPKLLTTQAKDLDVATWFTEAMTRRYGFAGLRDALLLIEGLVANFWDGLFPMPDEDGIETRVAQLAGLNGRSSDGVLIVPIRRVPITEGYTPGPFAYYQYQQAVEIERISNEETKESRSEKLGFTLATIEQAVAHSDVSFFINLIDDIAEVLACCKRLEDNLEALCGLDDAPSMRSIITVVEECRAAVSHLTKDILIAEADDQAVTDSISDSNENDSPQKIDKNQARDIIDNREAAFKKLLEISDFFKKTEPHSPISYALEKAVKWGNMALDELIVELIPDDSARRHFTMLTGVQHHD